MTGRRNGRGRRKRRILDNNIIIRKTTWED